MSKTSIVRGVYVSYFKRNDAPYTVTDNYVQEAVGNRFTNEPPRSPKPGQSSYIYPFAARTSITIRIVICSSTMKT